uniref:D-lactate dehydrogenase (cytochrome) n=1 Tax=Setaria digitata TaxID=48799 RepID=A0A915PY48_9BILA
MIVGNESNDAVTDVGKDAWVVHPIPGYVLKFKEVSFNCHTLMVKEKCKFFLNICHCAQLPPPLDLSEDEVAKLLDSTDPSRYRIPLCVGDVEVVLDRKGENSIKVMTDVIVNSTFYLMQLEKSEFFRQLLLLVVSEAIEKKHDIKVDVKEAIKLKNRKCMGDLSAQRIRKRPREAFIKEVEPIKQSEEQLPEQHFLPKYCLLLLRNGRQLEVNLKLGSVKPPIKSIDRLSIRMNDDHLLIILDRRQTILDIYFPVKVDYKKAAGKILSDEEILQILVPVVWSGQTYILKGIVTLFIVNMLLSRRLLNKVSQPFISQLEGILGKEAVKITAAAGKDSQSEKHMITTSDVVVLPKNVEQVSAVVKICNESSIPVIPFSVTDSSENFTSSLQEGVLIDLMLMDKIVDINTSDFDCTVEPGVTHEILNQHLHKTGLWFPADPGVDGSICGMAAASASGINAVRYGAMVRNVLNLEVVLSNGNILHTSGKGRRPRKSAAGYNLTKLFVGSKGTLGVITQAAVRLYARPAVCSAAICPFRTVDKAIEAVVATLQCSVPVAKIEFLDAVTVAACNRYNKLTLVESPTLFLEFHGNSEAEVAGQASFVEEIFASNDGTEFTWCHAPEEQKKLWSALHSVYHAVVSQKDNIKGLTIDVSVPMSTLAIAIAETRKDIDESGILGAIVGHVGDGNFHCIFLVDESNQEEMKIIRALSDRIVQYNFEKFFFIELYRVFTLIFSEYLVKRALVSGGSCTGEHGIGISEKKYLENECGEVAGKKGSIFWELVCEYSVHGRTTEHPWLCAVSNALPLCHVPITTEGELKLT